MTEFGKFGCANLTIILKNIYPNNIEIIEITNVNYPRTINNVTN